MFKGTGAVVVCHLSNFDVYTLTQPVRGAPTKYVFGLRAQDKAKMYENPEDYLSFLCAEDSESFMEFVLGIRCAKVDNANLKDHKKLLTLEKYGVGCNAIPEQPAACLTSIKSAVTASAAGGKQQWRGRVK